MLDGQHIITGGTLLLLFAFVFKTNKDNRDTVSRVYKRLDEVKEVTDTVYTRKDVCVIRHEQITVDLKEIKGDVKKLLTKNGLK